MATHLIFAVTAIRFRSPARQRGFTLVELIIVIVIMGVIGGMVSVFIKSPIDAYFASARRAALTDVADTTVRRMSRDLRSALPNSARIPNPDNQCIEFIPTKAGGQYRVTDLVAGDGTSLSFEAGTTDDSFNMLSKNMAMPASQRIAVGDVIVIYNLGDGSGSDAYKQDNTAQVTGVSTSTAAIPETSITIRDTKDVSMGKLFLEASPSNRFQVIPKDENIVAYVCQGGNLYRSARPLAEAASSSCPVNGAMLASNVVNCKFNYDVGRAKNAFISLNIGLTDSTGETVSLQHEVHMGITP